MATMRAAIHSPCRSGSRACRAPLAGSLRQAPPPPGPPARAAQDHGKVRLSAQPHRVTWHTPAQCLAPHLQRTCGAASAAPAATRAASRARRSGCGASCCCCGCAAEALGSASARLERVAEPCRWAAPVGQAVTRSDACMVLWVSDRAMDGAGRAATAHPSQAQQAWHHDSAHMQGTAPAVLAAGAFALRRVDTSLNSQHRRLGIEQASPPLRSAARSSLAQQWRLGADAQSVN